MAEPETPHMDIDDQDAGKGAVEGDRPEDRRTEHGRLKDGRDEHREPGDVGLDLIPGLAARRSAARARISPLSESRSSMTSVASPTDVRYTPPRPKRAESTSGGMFDTTSMTAPTSNRTSGPGWLTI